METIGIITINPDKIKEIAQIIESSYPGSLIDAEIYSAGEGIEIVIDRYGYVDLT